MPDLHQHYERRCLDCNAVTAQCSCRLDLPEQKPVEWVPGPCPLCDPKLLDPGTVSDPDSPTKSLDIPGNSAKVSTPASPDLRTRG